MHDFAGPYTIGCDNMAFGSPTRYLALNATKITQRRKSTVEESWDSSIEVGDEVYSKRMHNLWCVRAPDASAPILFLSRCRLLASVDLCVSGRACRAQL